MLDRATGDLGYDEQYDAHQDQSDEDKHEVRPPRQVGLAGFLLTPAPPIKTHSITTGRPLFGAFALAIGKTFFVALLTTRMKPHEIGSQDGGNCRQDTEPSKRTIHGFDI